MNQPSAEEAPIRFGDVRPFPCRPTDESVYCYPHKYRIDTRRVSGVNQQRHTFIWNDGHSEAEEWIRGLQ
jgi:hypothetical protein